MTAVVKASKRVTYTPRIEQAPDRQGNEVPSAETARTSFDVCRKIVFTLQDSPLKLVSETLVTGD